MDVRFIDEYCIVTDIVTNNNIIAEKLTARVETGHTITKYTDLAVIPIASLPAIPPIGEWIESGKIYAYGSKMVKCVQSHWRMSFAPELTPALFLIIEPSVGIPAWKQPTGAHDAYQIGDKVTYKGLTWESKIAANVTVPDGDVPYNRYWAPIL